LFCRGGDLRTEEQRIVEKYARRERLSPLYSWFDPGHVFLLQEVERQILRRLRRAGIDSLESKRILEVGCGHGFWLRQFIKWGAHPGNLTGVELLPERVERARTLCPAAVTILSGSAAATSLPEDSFDIVLQSMMFTSIQDSELKRAVAAEMMRVVRRDGLILWYDFWANNPWNPDVTGVRKSEIRALFPGCRIDLHPITLAAPLARRLARWSWMTCYVLGRVPWFCTHYIGIIRKAS
jgi:SAM-dependent methyltransferase